jgi:phospholipid transport system substrate-binding protein
MVSREPMKHINLKKAGAVAAALGLAISPFAATKAAAASDPAASQIETLDANLLSVMKQAKALGFHGRYTKMRPVVDAAFDLPVMTRFAVGPSWSTMSEAQHTALISAFTRLIVSSYAHNFDGYGGEKFVMGQVQTRGVDKLVQTQIIQASGKAVTLTYRMRQSGSSWKVIDVYYQGSVSELTTRRSDFATTLAAGGEPALVAHLNTLSDKLAH